MKKRTLIACLVVLAGRSWAMADAVVVVRAMTASTVMEAFLDESMLRVEIEMSIADVTAFVNLLPDEIYDQLDMPPTTAAQRLSRFVTEDLVFRADGEPLIGRLVGVEMRTRIERDEVTGEPAAAGEGDAEPVIFFVLEYPLKGRPESISVKVPDRETPGASANIGFVFYHLGVAANDFRYLVTGSTIDLDWDDPWHSRFRSRQLRRSYDAPLNLFLYVEPFEVRVEIIIRPLDAQRWVDLGLDGRDTITPEMYGSIQSLVSDLLAEHLDLTIDGQTTSPVLDRTNFLRRTLRSSTVIDPPEPLSVFTAQLGVIFVVPRESLPQQARLTWDLFSDTIGAIPAAATDEAGPLPTTLTPEDNVLRWQNFLVDPTIPTIMSVITPPRMYTRLLPAVSWAGGVGFVALLGLAGFRLARTRVVPTGVVVAASILLAAAAVAVVASRQAAVSEQRSGEIVGALLHNVYRSFDYRKESAIYDTLARSIDGDFLTQAYLETHRTLELRNQGGARVKVSSVELLECHPEPMDDDIGFTADCRWIVAGSVGHWGHIHQRRNEMDALVTVRAVGGDWKITQMELRGAERQ
jgi:hypothetical protein